MNTTPLTPLGPLATPVFAADDVVVIGTSTGGIDALRIVLGGLPLQFPAAVLVVMHIGSHDSILPSLLAGATQLPVRHARDGDILEPGRVLVAPPDRHLLLQRDGDRARVALAHGPRENHARPAIDPLFRSAAAAFGARATAVILTGMLDDGTAGLQAIKECGGKAVVQLPEDAFAADMPASALRHVEVDHVLRLPQIAAMLDRIVGDSLVAARNAPRQVPDWIRLENRFAAGSADMDSLAKFGTPSTFTCPECHGSLWELHGLVPRRYRCHTGHAYTEKVLADHQCQAVEESLWAALRALQEKERLLRQMADEAIASGHAGTAVDYVEQAAQAQRSGEVLRRLLTAAQDGTDTFVKQP
ncbi:two-component system chemotaxis response regulator CheB [Pseudoduganella lurida]|uniref:protein-glutamate methylesterase n=1 Tax=Pseudoduganella lurida TaxID=1036180 RepID=A0A562RF36_9BURK|nr:chemotaxis protein CheB [Pseudoduganella lurida]TWI67679.1 two-component system chemotaxis response regulator CheB [Pseudoduganella lurida]